jgi:aminomuconate-semialdehyde/2-hydroxymuconate-6-semialdehyde dehydrogenase
MGSMGAKLSAAASESVIDGLDHSASSGWTWVPSIRRRTPHEPRRDLGPVACLLPFDTEDEALEQANTTEFGLAASVWTRELQRGHRIAQRLEIGRSGSTPGWSRICGPFGGTFSLGRQR